MDGDNPVNKRIVIVISVEGNPMWVDAMLRSMRLPAGKGVTFSPYGTIRRLHVIEMQEREDLLASLLRALNESE